MIAFAYGAALGARVGWILGLGLSVCAVLAVLTLSPVVAVTPTHLHVGRASLPRTSIADCTTLQRDEAAVVRGTGADARSYVMLRSLHAQAAVLVSLDDPTDPHPSWLVTTRNPEALTEALSS